MAGKSKKEQPNASFNRNKQTSGKLNVVEPTTNVSSSEDQQQTFFAALFGAPFLNGVDRNSFTFTNIKNFFTSPEGRNKLGVVLSCAVLLCFSFHSHSNQFKFDSNVASMDVLTPIMEQVLTADMPVPVLVSNEIIPVAKKIVPVKEAITIPKTENKTLISANKMAVKPAITTTNQPVLASKPATQINIPSLKEAEPNTIINTNTTSTKPTKPLESVGNNSGFNALSPNSFDQPSKLATKPISNPTVSKKAQEVKQTNANEIKLLKESGTVITPKVSAVVVEEKPQEEANDYEKAVNSELESSESSIMTTYRSLMSKAGTEGKLMMLRFSADWCVPCRVMEETVLKDQKVQHLINTQYLTLKVDIQAFDGYNLKEKYSVKKIPAILIFNSQGELIAKYDKAFSTTEMLSMLEKHNTPTNREAKKENPISVKVEKEVEKITEVLTGLKQRVY